MRISDWSSDVCSSDLQHARMQPVFRHLVGEARPSFAPACGPSQVVLAQALPVAGVGLRDPFGEWTPAPGRFPLQYVFEIRDRKSVVEGKSVSVRVDLGCRRSIKKQNTQATHN